MTTTAPSPRTKSGPGTRSQSSRVTGPTQLIGPWQNALEGAGAALCAVAAMTAVSAGALVLLGAQSFGSVWSLTMVLTAMAIGGSVSAGSDASADSGSTGGLASLFGDGGGMGPSMSGAADAVPLGVTLVGALVLWTAYSRRLRMAEQRRFTGGELVVRAAGAGTAALVILMIVAGLGHGSARLPESATTGAGGFGGRQGAATSSGSGGLAELFGGASAGLGDLMGAGDGGLEARTSMTYHVGVGSAGLGALLWVVVVIGAGCLMSRRARLPLGGALDRIRPVWGPSLSAVVRAILVVTAVLVVALVFVEAMAGGRAGTAAGAAVLLVPNAVAVFLSLGVGSAWTAEVHPAVGGDGGGNPLAVLLGGTAGIGGDVRQPDRTEHLRSLSAGGWPLWLAALVVTILILIACAALAARGTAADRRLPLIPYRGRLSRHVAMAERFGVVTAVVLGLAAWLVGASGQFGVTMFGSTMGGMRAELSGSVLLTVVLGLLVGGAAGFAGSLLCAVRGDGEAAVTPDLTR
ncbi:streptophobe family protein [Streptomyces sp. NPDC051985]|uniref:streptophobe family protein n=1 Tax=Streptomyces sp. NPDC051985 TaxID=3155807 RepID=UPI00342436BA